MAKSTRSAKSSVVSKSSDQITDTGLKESYFAKKFSWLRRLNTSQKVSLGVVVLSALALPAALIIAQQPFKIRSQAAASTATVPTGYIIPTVSGPTAVPTMIPSPTYKPTPSPTIKPSPTPTKAPSPTPIPTATLTPTKVPAKPIPTKAIPTPTPTKEPEQQIKTPIILSISVPDGKSGKAYRGTATANYYLSNSIQDSGLIITAEFLPQGIKLTKCSSSLIKLDANVSRRTVSCEISGTSSKKVVSIVKVVAKNSQQIVSKLAVLRIK